MSRSTSATQTNWHNLRSKHFVIYYQEESEGSRAQNIARKLYPRMKSDFDYWPVSKISIYVYHDHSSFLSNSPSGVSRAYSQPFMNKIYISATRGSMDSAIAHELSHVVFLQSLPDPTGIPFWFSEGTAIYWSQLYAKSSKSSYPVQGQVDSISRLSKERPRSIQEQEKISAQGYLAVQYLVDRYGKDRFKLLIKNLQKGMILSAALEKSMGTSQDELDKAWLVYASARSQEVYIETLQYFGFMIMGLLVFISAGLWLKKRKDRAAELQQELTEEHEDILNY